MSKELKVILVVWLVLLHLFFAGIVFLYFDVTGGLGLGSYSETPTPLQLTASANREPNRAVTKTAEASSYSFVTEQAATALTAARFAFVDEATDGDYDGVESEFDPCVPVAVDFDHCTTSRTVEPTRAVSEVLATRDVVAPAVSIAYAPVPEPMQVRPTATPTREAASATPMPATPTPTIEVSATATPALPTSEPTATATVESPPIEIEPTIAVQISPTPESEAASTESVPVIPPCTPYPGSDKNPCERRVPWEWPTIKDTGFVASVWAPWPPYTVREWVDWAFETWITVPHVILRGVPVPGSTRCATHKPSVVLKGTATDELLVFNAWTDIDCYTDIAVREYIFGTGPSVITYTSGGRTADEVAGDFGEVDRDAEYFAEITSPLSESLEGYEWVFWLVPPLDASKAAWDLVLLRDVQRLEDGTVAAVSDSRTSSHDNSKYLDKLEPTLDSFVTDTKAAMAHYVKLYGGRVGESAEAPKFIPSAHLSSVLGYIKLMGALEVPGFTYTAPPPSPLLPAPPTGLLVTRWTNPIPEVDLEWYAPVSSTVTHYKIVRIDSLGNEKVIAEALPGEFTETTDRDLPVAGVEYTYTVIAVNDHGESAPSGGKTVRNGPPNPPTDLYVSLQPVNEADLEWYAPPSSHVTGYRVERKQGNGAWVTLQDNIPSEYLETTDFGLVSGQAYTYRVIALGEWADSAPSTPYILHVP